MSTESVALQEFRRSVFGTNVGGERVPDPYLMLLRRMTEHASAVLGVRVNSTSRIAYWVDGKTVGTLGCVGNTEADAQVDGRVVRLDRLDHLDIAVRTERRDPSDESYDYGRVLKLSDFEIDARPGYGGPPDQRARTEAFINAVLAAAAERP